MSINVVVTGLGTVALAAMMSVLQLNSMSFMPAFGLASAGAILGYRAVKAALHEFAAEIELATPASERWCVNCEDFNESGRLYLELADATPAEAERGLAMLTKLVGVR